MRQRNTDLDEGLLRRWQGIADLLARIMEVRCAIITRVDPPFIEVLRSSRSEGNPYPNGARVEIAGHYCEEVVRSRKSLHVRNAPEEERWKQAPEIGYEMISYLGYPLRWPNGDIFGTLCVLHDTTIEPPALAEETMVELQQLVEAHLGLLYTARELRQRNMQLEDQLAELERVRTLLPLCPRCGARRGGEAYLREVRRYQDDLAEGEEGAQPCPACEEKAG